MSPFLYEIKLPNGMEEQVQTEPGTIVDPTYLFLYSPTSATAGHSRGPHTDYINLLCMDSFSLLREQQQDCRDMFNNYF